MNQWYNERAANEKDERMRIVEAAATIIREDIRMTPYSTTDYPDITALTENVEVMVPETLQEFLKGVVA